MKPLCTLCLQLFVFSALFSQTVKTDAEIQIGQSSNSSSEAGAIRWTGEDFEGFTGTEWISLTKTNENIISNSFSSSLWGRAVLTAYEDQFVLAPDANNLDQFGQSVDIDGDVAVIGAHGDDEKGTDAGAAYIFEKENNGWVFKAKLTPSTVAADQWFGGSVAISGETVVVGAYATQGSTGAAYVFQKPAGGWFNMTETASLISTDLGGDDQFGFSVAIDGNTIVVGAQKNDVTFANTGTAYIYIKPSSGGWVDAVENAKLLASDATFEDRFGYDVDIDDDVIVVSAPYDDETASASGSVYIFEKPDQGWVSIFEDHKLNASDAAMNELFGWSVSVDSAVIVVGAPQNDGNFGGAYVFSKGENGWSSTTETAKLIAADRRQDFFGWSVAVDNGVIAVGSINQDFENNISNSGSVYLFESVDGIWTDQFSSFQLIGSNILSSATFGRDVSIFDNTILVGASLANAPNGNTGKAFFYNRR